MRKRAHPTGVLTVPVPVVARLLGMGTTATWEAVWRGDIASVVIGRRRLVPASEIARLAGVTIPDVMAAVEADFATGGGDET